MYVYCILTWRVSLVERELLTIPENLNSPRFLILCVSFVDRCLSFCTFSCGHCLRFTDSDYSFGIFKFFFSSAKTEWTMQRHILMGDINGDIHFKVFFYLFFFFRYSWYPPNIQLINYVEDFFYECHGGCNFTVCCKEIYLNCKI